MRITPLAVMAACLYSTALTAADEAPCEAGLICANQPQTVVTAVQNAGFTANLKTDSKGPYIMSAAAGYQFSIYFFDCTNAELCRSLQFNVVFAPSDQHTGEYANGYNRLFRYAQASALPGKELRLSYDLNTEGGITRANFDGILRNWSGALGSFVTYARQQQMAPAPMVPPNAPSATTSATSVKKPI